MKYYTGIGSRETPLEALIAITSISRCLDVLGYTLRSGAANGADTAFEHGTTNTEIWVPWLGFNGSKSMQLPTPEAFKLAETLHPRWNILSQGAKKLHARNTHQVLGADLNTPSRFLICWTLNGATVGGTATAINLALNRNIPILNLGKYKPESMELVVEDFLILIGESNDL